MDLLKFAEFVSLSPAPAQKHRGHRCYVTEEHTYNVLYGRLLISIHDLSVLYSIMISYTVNYCLVVPYSRFHQISIHYLLQFHCLLKNLEKGH